MKITPEQNSSTAEPLTSNTLKPVKPETPAAPTDTTGAAEELAANANVSAAQPVQRLTDVTLHQDANGKSYYVVSDAHSGQEIIEVPPKAVRDASQGIQQYLKEEESRNTPHVKIKA